MSQYVYTKSPVALDSLEAQIAASSIVTAIDIDNTNVFGDQLTLAFKADLSDPDKSTLDALVDAHDGVPLAITVPPQSVITAFEQRDFVLQLACSTAEVGEDGTATVLMKIPGTPGGTDGRYINAGEAFFNSATAGDKILGVWMVDHDNILGGGVDTVVGTYTDDSADTENQGWYIPPIRGFVKAETIGFYGFIPSGFYLKMIGKKGAGITTGNLYVNMEWAIKSP